MTQDRTNKTLINFFLLGSKKFSVIDAIHEIKKQYENKKFTDSDRCYTVRWMRKIKV